MAKIHSKIVTHQFEICVVYDKLSSTMSTQYVYTICLHDMSTQYVYTLCLHDMSTQYVYTICLHDMSTRYVYTICLHDMSTQYVYTICLTLTSTNQGELGTFSPLNLTSTLCLPGSCGMKFASNLSCAYEDTRLARLSAIQSNNSWRVPKPIRLF